MTVKKATKPEKYNAAAAPELLYQMSKASQQGEPASFYLKAADKRPELGVAIAAYAPGAVSSARKFGDSLRPLAGQQQEYCGETLTLKSRFVNRKHSTQWAVDGSLRLRILKARATANLREAQVQATAFEAAKLIRAGKSLAELETIIGKPAAAAPTHHSVEALRISREANWDPPAQPAGHYTPRDAPPTSPAIRPVEPERPEPVRAPEPVVDTTGWPPAWLKHGKPSYHTPTHEAPDPSFKNDQVRTEGRRAHGVEVFDFNLSDAEREARKPRKWSPF